MSAENRTGDWKEGTEVLAICMICGAEYDAGTKMCPDCDASLSLVRRCPNCHRIVSSQHKKCVYCHTLFTNELPKNIPTAAAVGVRLPPISKDKQRLRAIAVSAVTFIVVFCAGYVFLRSIRQSEIPVLRVLATAKVSRAVELRRAPSLNSAVLDKVAPGTMINITGSVTGAEGRGWMVLDWNNAVAYLPSVDLTPPKVVEVDGGTNVLKLYLVGMEPESVDDTVKAVEHYTQAFPGDVRGEELRWVLAERIRTLSQHAGPAEVGLRRQAHQQYEALAALNGGYAEKARDVLKGLPLPSIGGVSPRRGERKVDGLEIVGGSGTQVSDTKSAAHEVLVLNRAEVVVRAGKLSHLATGAVVQGRVSRPVKTNGIVAIPAGASCQLTVMSADSSNVALELRSIEIDHRVYAVKSEAIETPSGDSAKQVADHALMFHLNAPLVIQR
jgi:hypothetical protein